MKFWERNSSRWPSGNDTEALRTGLVFFALLIALLIDWELTATYKYGFAAQHSNPSNVIGHVANRHDWYRMYVTGLRGVICILFGYFVAYPLGVMVALYGRFTMMALMTLCLLLSLAKLGVILFFLRFFSYSETSIYAIGLWTSGLSLMAYGLFNTLFGWVIDKENNGAQMEAATLDGASWWNLYYEIVLPQVFPQRIAATFIVSGSVWTSISYAESRVPGTIQGLGERMSEMVENSSTMGHFYSVSLMLTALSAGTWIVIGSIMWLSKRRQRMYN